MEERQKRIALQEKLDDEHSARQLLQKDEELKKRLERIRIRDEELQQREDRLGRRRTNVRDRQLQDEITEENPRQIMPEREIEDTPGTPYRIVKPKVKTVVPQLQNIQQSQVKEDGDSTDKVKDNKQTVLDTQYLFPKFTVFSGEEPKPKTEATFEKWKFEVNCTRKAGNYSETMVAQAIRKSLRNPAKKALYSMDLAASVDAIMGK